MFFSHDTVVHPTILHFRFKYLGNPSKTFTSGGASYLLSQAAFEHMLQAPQWKTEECNKDAPSDVWAMHCLHAVGVPPEPALDKEGRNLFHPFVPNNMFSMGMKDGAFMMDWWLSYEFKPRAGLLGVSDKTLTYHYMHPDLFYETKKALDADPDSIGLEQWLKGRTIGAVRHEQEKWMNNTCAQGPGVWKSINKMYNGNTLDGALCIDGHVRLESEALLGPQAGGIQEENLRFKQEEMERVKLVSILLKGEKGGVGTSAASSGAGNL